MKIVENFTIFFGPRKSSKEDPSFEEIAKTSDQSADTMFIEFVHEAITSIMVRPSPQMQSSLDNIFSDVLNRPVWVNDTFLTCTDYPDRSYPGITLYPSDGGMKEEIQWCPDRSYPGITFYPDKIVDRHGTAVAADFSEENLIHGIGSVLGYVLEVEWIRIFIVMNDVQNSQNLSDRKSILLKELNDIWPAHTMDQEGSLRVFSIHASTAPIITVMRTNIKENAKVPVYFISVRDKAEFLVNDQYFHEELHKITEGLAPLVHTIKGSSTESFLMIPFLYHMFPSAKAFHRAMENYLKQHEKSLGLCWVVENCYVLIHHEGKDYEPKDSQKSLNM